MFLSSWDKERAFGTVPKVSTRPGLHIHHHLELSARGANPRTQGKRAGKTLQPRRDLDDLWAAPWLERGSRACGSRPCLKLVDYCPASWRGGCSWRPPEFIRDLAGSQLMRIIFEAWHAVQLGCSYECPSLTEGNTPQLTATDAIELDRVFRLGLGCRNLSSAFTDSRPARQPPAQNRVDFNAFSLALRRRLSIGDLPWFAGSPLSRLQVAVHIRRGDLSTFPWWSSLDRWVPDEYYERGLHAVGSALRSRGIAYDIHVVSEGAGWAALRPAWERRLLGAGAASVAWHIDEGLLPSLTHLIEADVLVMGGSAFSHLAALYQLGLGLVDAAHAPPVHALWMLDRRHVVRMPPSRGCSCVSHSFEQELKRVLSHGNATMDKSNYEAYVSRLGDSLSAPLQLPSSLSIQPSNDNRSTSHRCRLFCRSESAAVLNANWSAAQDHLTQQAARLLEWKQKKCFSRGLGGGWRSVWSIFQESFAFPHGVPL